LVIKSLRLAIFDSPLWCGCFTGCWKTAPQAVIRRCAAFANAHISINMLRFPKRRTPWLTAWCLFF